MPPPEPVAAVFCMFVSVVLVASVAGREALVEVGRAGVLVDDVVARGVLAAAVVAEALGAAAVVAASLGAAEADVVAGAGGVVRAAASRSVVVRPAVGCVVVDLARAGRDVDEAVVDRAEARGRTAAWGGRVVVLRRVVGRVVVLDVDRAGVVPAVVGAVVFAG